MNMEDMLCLSFGVLFWVFSRLGKKWWHLKEKIPSVALAFASFKFKSTQRLSWNIWVIKLYCCVYQKGKTKPVRPMFLCTKCLRKKVLQWIPLPPCITACTCCVSHWIHFIAVSVSWCNDSVNARIVGLPLRSLGPKIKDPCVARSTSGAESEHRIQIAKL